MTTVGQFARLIQPVTTFFFVDRVAIVLTWAQSGSVTLEFAAISAILGGLPMSVTLPVICPNDIVTPSRPDKAATAHMPTSDFHRMLLRKG